MMMQIQICIIEVLESPHPAEKEIPPLVSSTFESHHPSRHPNSIMKRRVVNHVTKEKGSLSLANTVNVADKCPL